MGDLFPGPDYSSDAQEQVKAPVPSDSGTSFASSFVHGITGITDFAYNHYKEQYIEDFDPGKNIPAKDLPEEFAKDNPGGMSYNLLKQKQAEKDYAYRDQYLEQAAPQTRFHRYTSAGFGIIGGVFNPVNDILGGYLGKVSGSALTSIVGSKLVTPVAEKLVGKIGAKTTQSIQHGVAGLGVGGSFQAISNVNDYLARRQYGDDKVNLDITNGLGLGMIFGGIGGGIHGHFSGLDKNYRNMADKISEQQIENDQKVNVTPLIQDGFVKSANDSVEQYKEENPDSVDPRADLKQKLSDSVDQFTEAMNEIDEDNLTEHPNGLDDIDNPDTSTVVHNTLNRLHRGETETLKEHEYKSNKDVQDVEPLKDIINSVADKEEERSDSQKDLLERGKREPDFESNLINEAIENSNKYQEKIKDRIENKSKRVRGKDRNNYINKNKILLKDAENRHTALTRRKLILKAAKINKRIKNLTEKLNDKDGPKKQDRRPYIEEKKQLNDKLDKMQQEQFPNQLPNLRKVVFSHERTTKPFRDLTGYWDNFRKRDSAQLHKDLLEMEAPTNQEILDADSESKNGPETLENKDEVSTQEQQLVSEAEANQDEAYWKNRVEQAAKSGLLPDESYKEVLKSIAGIDDDVKEASKKISDYFSCRIGSA